MEISNYEKIRLTTDVVILTTEDKEAVNHRKVPEKGIQVLLIKRDEEPFKDMWSLPGGFVPEKLNFEETIRQMNEHGISLVGAVHDYTAPVTGKGYLYFPIREV